MSDKSIYPSDPSHPDHGMFQQIERGVHALDAGMGRTPDANSERMTASLYAHLKTNEAESGMRQVDHVVLSAANDRVRAGEYVIMVQGALNDPANRLLAMKTTDALNQSVEASFSQLDGLNRQEDMVRGRQQDAPLQQQEGMQRATQEPHVLR